MLDESGKTGDWEFYTPSKAYADFRLLSALPKVDLEVVPEIEIKGDECSVELKVHNPGNAVAFFVEFGLLKYDRDPVLPVFWDDNYISLLPDESRTVRCTCSNAKLGGKKPVLEVQGWNTDYREVYG